MRGLTSTLIVGLIAGTVARLVIPDKEDISISMTIVIGIIGSFIGGFLGYPVSHEDGSDGFLQPPGLTGSILGAVIILLVWTKVDGRKSVRR